MKTTWRVRASGYDADDHLRVKRFKVLARRGDKADAELEARHRLRKILSGIKILMLAEETPIKQARPSCGVIMSDVQGKPQLPGRKRDANDAGISMAEITTLMGRTQSRILKCPCCRSDAELKTYDTMVYTIQCKGMNCHLKVERGVVNERGPKECIKLVLRAWNRRPTGQADD